MKRNSLLLACSGLLMLVGTLGCTGGSCACTPGTYATVSGQVKTSRGQPLANVEVQALIEPAMNYPLATARTDAEGRYSLSVSASSCRVVCQPHTETTAYGVLVSHTLHLDPDNASQNTADFTATEAAACSIEANITPAITATQTDTINLWVVQTVDGAVRSFPIRSVNGSLNQGVEKVTFSGLPAGNYSVRASRMDPSLTIFLGSDPLLVSLQEGPATAVELAIH
jgi:hypothetical protein